MKERLLVIYRSSPGEGSQRPNYFTKLKALESFINSIKKIDDKKIIFLNDGIISDEQLKAMSKVGEITSLDGIGNGKSFRYALNIAITKNPELVYFAEDDYYYLPFAFEELLSIAKRRKNIHYFTLYDSPRKYESKTRKIRDFKAIIYKGERVFWRTEPATCMTFLARVKYLRKDSFYFKLFTIGTSHTDSKFKRLILRKLLTMNQYPWDLSLWNTLLGPPPGKLANKVYWPLKLVKRKLLGPIPSLACHINTSVVEICDDANKQFLTPFVNWEIGKLSVCGQK